MTEQSITQKICFECKQAKPVREFSKSRYNKDGYVSYCRPCRNARTRRNERRKREVRGQPIIPAAKHCPNCNQTKPASEFHSNRSQADGLSDNCRECASAYYRSRHPLPEQPPEIEGEIWRPAIGFEGRYEVSNIGRVRRSRMGGSTYKGRIMKMSITWAGRGYYSVHIAREGRARTVLVHRLVAAAFLDPSKRHMHVNHKNGDTRDNRVENLEYVTMKENTQHARRILKVGARKLTEDTVRSIRRERESGALHKDIAAKYGLAQSTVTRIVNRLSWAHVE